MKILSLFKQIKLLLTVICFLSVIFLSGYALGLGLIEKIQAENSLPFFADGPFFPPPNYLEMFVRLCLIGVGFLICLIIYRIGKRKIFSIISLILTLILNYQIFLSIKFTPEFVPGLRNEQSMKMVESVLFAENLLLILGIILAILQIASFWQEYRSPTILEKVK